MSQTVESCLSRAPVVMLSKAKHLQPCPREFFMHEILQLCLRMTSHFTLSFLIISVDRTGGSIKSLDDL